MSEITRKGLTLLLNSIGKAKDNIISRIGDTSKNRGSLYDTEKVVIKLRGSTNFHDYDLCKKDPIFGTSTLPSLNKEEKISFGIQGGTIIKDDKIGKFATTTLFDAELNSPPSPEGWGIYDYNAWSSYIPRYNSSGIANTNLVIYGTEPSGGIARTNYAYPVKYSSFTYTRVPLFNCARYLSFNCPILAYFVNEIHIVIEKKYFDGVLSIDPLTNTPIDLGIYYHNSLFTSSKPGLLLGAISTGEALTALAYNTSECDEFGSTSSRNKNYYLFKIKFPINIPFEQWGYLVFYFGTHDTFFRTGYPSYSSGIATTFLANSLGSNYIVNPKKSFFKNDFNNYLTFDKTGINDSNVYLYSANKTHFEYIDGDYTDPTDPLRYQLNESIQNIDPNGDINSVSGYSNVNKFEYIAVSLATRNSGSFYELPKNSISVFYSNPISLENALFDWAEYTNYPSVPNDYDVICNLILYYPDSFSSGTIRVNANLLPVLNDCSIVYMEMKADNYAKSNIEDLDVTSYLFNPFQKILENLRSKNIFKTMDIISFSMNPYAARMNTNNFKNISQFSDNNQNFYKIFHNLLKKPIDSLITSSTEPFNLELSSQAIKQTSDWAILSPTTRIAALNSNELVNYNIKLPKNTEFELYQEEAYVCEAVNPNISGNKVGQDYTFRIKFEDTSENYLIKDLYVNNSTFYLTDEEYQNRLDKNLSMIGYYKASTLSNINDYRLYGYSAVIPDLSMGESRTIDTRVVTPIDSTITSEDYQPNLNKYSNQFNSIKDLGVCVSNYSYSPEPYWINNIQNLVGCTNIESVVDPETTFDYVADSFTIATSGYNTTDGSIRYIENVCEQKNTVDVSSVLNQLTYAGNKDIEKSKIAIKLSPAIDTSIKNFIIKLLKTTNVSNQYAYVQAELWSSLNNLPNTKLISGSKIYLDSLSNTIADYEFNLLYDLKANDTYWLVLNFNAFPEIYDTNTTGLVNVTTTSVEGVYDYDLQTTTNFSKYNTGSSIGFGSTVASSISSWYTISNIISSSQLTLSTSSTTLTKQKYVIKHKLQLGILESSIVTATPYKLAFYSNNEWTAAQGTAYIKFFTKTLEVLGLFNRTVDDYDNMLPPPNQQRSDPPSYQVDGHWSYTCKELITPQTLSIYPRAFFTNAIIRELDGTLGNNYLLIDEVDFSNSILVGMKVTDSSSSTHVPNNTTITSIVYDSGLSKYYIYLSNLLGASFIGELIYFGEDKYVYARRSKDMHVLVRYYQDSKLVSKYILLEKSDRWSTKWYKKTSGDYGFIDEGVEADIITTTNGLTFQNYDVNGQSEYFNGVATGIFTPKTSLAGNTYTFRIQCSGGFRLYINNSSTPNASFDNWTNTSLSTSTGSITVTSPIQFRLEFTHTTGDSYLSFQYNDGSGYKDINNINFYTDSEPSPVLIDSNPIEKIVYLAVGKTYEDVNTYTFGAPPGDRLVFRNK
jgi:hypothetical protein